MTINSTIRSGQRDTDKELWGLQKYKVTPAPKPTKMCIYTYTHQETLLRFHIVLLFETKTKQFKPKVAAVEAVLTAAEPGESQF